MLIDVCRLIFEKYDGVRGFWNPEKKAFYSRYGNELPLPRDVIVDMPPDLFLDGELWYVKIFQELHKQYNCLKVWQR